MPIMPRNPKNKATKIAYDILGKPENMKQKKNQYQTWLNKKLNREDTRLIK